MELDVTRQEHISDNRPRKAVGLFARDSYGTGVFELSAVSTASGAVLSVTPSSGNSQGVTTVFQGGSPWQAMATLYPRTDYVGLVSVSGNVAVSNTVNTLETGLISLASGTEVRTRAISNVTLNASNAFIGLVTVGNSVGLTGLVSLASGTEVRSLTTILPRTDYIGLVSVSGNVAVSALPVLPTGANYIGLVTAVIVGTVNTGMLTIFPGPNSIGLVTLNPSSAHIGSVSIFGTVESTPGMTTLFPGPNFIGLVTVSGLAAVTGSIGVSGLISLASGTEVRSLSTILGGSVGLTGLVSLASGTEVRSLTTILPRTDYIGLVSVSGNVAVSALPALAAGTNNIGDVDVLSIAAGANYIGLVSVNGSVVNLAGSNYIGLVTATNGVGDRFMGLVTSYPGRSVTTNYSGILSASGYSTIFVPPSGQRFYLHTAMINAKGVADGYIGSTSNSLIPWTGLATYGGFVHPNNRDAIPATAVDQSLTIRQHSLVTISYQVSVHFE